MLFNLISPRHKNKKEMEEVNLTNTNNKPERNKHSRVSTSRQTGP